LFVAQRVDGIEGGGFPCRSPMRAAQAKQDFRWFRNSGILIGR
jgi:hypothetical protein